MEEKKSRKSIIFTDGASRGNPGPGGWGAVIVMDSKVIELGGREEHTTNNQMELRAAIEALKKIKNYRGSTSIYTDSSYVINGITKWVYSWQKNNWMTKAKKDVLNKELWKKLIKSSHGKNIEWKYLGGHRGIAGNERCDEIATEYADGKKVKLYKGDIKNYKIDVLNISLDETKSKKRTKDRSRSKAKAYSYVSLVKGKIMTHQTWEECEKRVKGVSGAKFKKAISSEDEQKIIKEFRNNS